MVNGSLWTLPIEVAAYCLLCAAGIPGLVRRPWPLAALCVGLLAVVQLHPAVNVLSGLMVELTAYFLLGVLIRLYDVPVRPFYAVMAVGVLPLAVVTGVYVVAAPGLAYIILFLGTRRRGPLLHAGRWGDWSYGIYVYGYPLQQALLALGVRDLATLVLLSLIVTTLFGYLSWPVVERRLLVLARPRRSPALSATARQELVTSSR